MIQARRQFRSLNLSRHRFIEPLFLMALNRSAAYGLPSFTQTVGDSMNNHTTHFRWAEEHLLASPGFRLMNDLGETLVQIPTLVPKRQKNGHCHCLQNGLCSVHENSPFGCAFVSQCQQSAKQAESRNIAARLAREKAFQEDHLYAQIWNHLWEAGLQELTTQENIKHGVQEVRRLNEAQERHKINALKKAKRKQKKKQRQN